jgi:hypothetical protein
MTRKCPVVGFDDILAVWLSPIMRFQVFYLTKLSVAEFVCPQCQFRWPHDLRRWSAAAPLLALRVRIPPDS